MIWRDAKPWVVHSTLTILNILNNLIKFNGCVSELKKIIKIKVIYLYWYRVNIILENVSREKNV